ncbi:hypothetical protein L208DRAFT_914991 [Tricholoma matsutake]|nr:hypothetical protein L208DRAFT_914991 [Tricholoma matsutake 945]
MCTSTQRCTQAIETRDENSNTEDDSWKHGYGQCVSIEEGSLLLVTEVAKAIASKEAEIIARNDSSTQTDATTNVDVETQTAPFDITPTSPPSPAMSRSSTPSTSSTITTRLVFQCEPLPPTAQKRRHSLPSRPTAPQHTPLPPSSHLEAPSVTTTSSSTTTLTPAATAPKTTFWATASTQTASPTSEIVHLAVNDVHRKSTAQQTELWDYGETRSSERVVSSMDEPYGPHCPQRRSTTLPTTPQPLVSRPELATATATSQPTMATKTVATTRGTTTRVTTSCQMTATTSYTKCQAPNDVHTRSIAQQTTLREDEQMCSSKHVVYSTERPCSPQDSKRKPRTPPSIPHLVPQTPVEITEPPGETTMSYSMTPAAPLLPLSEQNLAPENRRHTLPGPSVLPQLVPVTPVRHPEPPTASTTSQMTMPIPPCISTSSMPQPTLSTHREAPRSPPASPYGHVYPSSSSSALNQSFCHLLHLSQLLLYPNHPLPPFCHPRLLSKSHRALG